METLYGCKKLGVLDLFSSKNENLLHILLSLIINYNIHYKLQICPNASIFLLFIATYVFTLRRKQI